MSDVHLSCTATDEGQTRILPSSAEQRPSSGRRKNSSPQEEAPLWVTGPGSPRRPFIVPIRSKSRPDQNRSLILVCVRPEPIEAIDHLSVRVSWARGLPAARASLEPRTECWMRKGVKERILHFTFQDGRLQKFERNKNCSTSTPPSSLHPSLLRLFPPLSPQDRSGARLYGRPGEAL